VSVERYPCADLAGRRCKRRGCRWCGPNWARAWGVVFRENLRHWGRRVVMLTLTPPGADRLPWDPRQCRGKRPHVCSGPRGCRVEDEAADAWSATLTKRWAALRQAVRVACRRRGHVPVLLARAWEPQKRGVPHLHLVFGCSPGPEEEAARAFLEELKRLAPEYDFGWPNDRFEPVHPDQVARYVVTYLTGRNPSRKSSIRENLSDPRMPRSLLWVAPVLTQATLVTMRRLRYARWVLAAIRNPSGCYPRLYGQLAVDVARVCARIDRRRGPPRDEDDPPPDHLPYFRAIRVMRGLQPTALA
jgi:hypothetical protein